MTLRKTEFKMGREKSMMEKWRDWRLDSDKEHLNESFTDKFVVHPTDPDQTERTFQRMFKELSKGHPYPIDYGPRESDMYDWNDRRNYYKSIEEYNKYMIKIANKLNATVKDMNNIWKTWGKIRDKHRKIDRST